MNEQIKINWYRTKVDRQVMSELMKTSDLRGFLQIGGQLALFALTTALAYLAYLNIHATNWPWAVPLMLAALFIHGTFAVFLSVPLHELSHKTPFRTKAWNEFFLQVSSFLTWSDYVGYRLSHVKHHQVTVHEDHDGEVVLPQRFDWYSVKFTLSILLLDPVVLYQRIRSFTYASFGEIRDGIFPAEWLNRVMPETNVTARREHRRWARIVFFGHLALAVIFILTGHWFLIIPISFGSFIGRWLGLLCGTPQHIGMAPNVADFRFCCRSYTCNPFLAFLYWNMQYHVEHHMFPAVPFYNLPKLRKAIEHDLPPVTHGLIATWKEILPILKKQRVDPNYVFVPQLPGRE